MVEQLVRIQVQLVKGIRAATIRALDEAIASAVAAHPHAQLFATMPRIGKVNLGQIIGEIGPILERSRTSDQFIAETGVVPVTRASGKARVVTSATRPTAASAWPSWVTPTTVSKPATGLRRSTTTPGRTRNAIPMLPASSPGPAARDVNLLA
ncbi:transposase [Streptomyces sp. NPDC055681]